MSPLIWVVVGSTALSCYFALISYSLRAFRRVQLEEVFSSELARARLDWLDSNLPSLRLMMSLLRSAANVTLVLGFAVLLVSHGPLLQAVYAAGGSLIVICIFGVGIPSAWAASAGERMLAISFPVLVALRYALWPIIALMHVFDVPIRRLSGVSDSEEETEEAAKQEVISAATEGRAGGAVDADELEMIESVMEFADTQAGEIMTPRTDIFALPADADFDQAVDELIAAGHTRVPVYQEDVDSIIGVLYAKDLLRHIRGDQPKSLKAIMRKPFFVPETKLLDDLLAEFKARKLHIAFVLDEYGGTAGLVTIEDVIEEIIGEIADEYDKTEPEQIKLIDETTAELDGRTYIDDLNDALKLEVPEDEDYDTAAGLILSELGHIPHVGETLEAYGAKFTVLAADERKITRLRVEVLAEGEGQEET